MAVQVPAPRRRRPGRRPRAAGRARPASSAAPATNAPRSGAWPAPDAAAAAGVTSVGMAGTSTSANDTWLAPVPSWRPGRNSSSTAWKLVPPNPNALTPARRTPPGGGSHGRSSVLTANGDRLKSMFGLGRSAWMLGGSTLWWSAMAALNRPAVPAAPFRWPMFDFTEPSGIEPAGTPSPPNTSVRASTSTTSPTARGRAVPLDERARRRGHARQLPGPLDGEPLADRVGGGDALAPPVARSRHAEQHGVDAVAVPLGVGQPLEQEQGAPLAHDEAVGAVGVGAGAGGRQRADLAELHVGGGAHVAVDAAGEDRVVLAVDQPLDRAGHGRQPGRAGGVGDVARPTEVEEVGDPSGDDVGQLARHGVLGDVGDGGPHALARLLEDRLAHLLGQGGERRRPLELAGELGEVDPQRGQVVPLPGHGVADHDRGPLVVERPLGPPVVDQRGPGQVDRPLLGVVHGVAHLRGDRELPPQRVPLEGPDPAADLRVGLVGCPGVGVVVQRGVPPVGGDLADGVAAVLDVLPEGRGVGGVGHDGGDADDRHGSVDPVEGLLGHDAPPERP